MSNIQSIIDEVEGIINSGAMSGNEKSGALEAIGLIKSIFLKRSECIQHEYLVLRPNWFKHDGGQNIVGKTFDQEISYTTLYCKYCGKTKEVISAVLKK